MDVRQKEDLQSQEQENDDLEKGETGSEEEKEHGSESESEEDEDEENEDEEPKFINQESVNKAINKQHKRFRDEERAHQETQRKLAEANKRLAELDKKEPPVIPPTPDPMDPQYPEKMKARDDAIKEHTHYEAEQNAAKKQVETQQQEAASQQQQAMQKSIQNYQARTQELGLDPVKNAEAEKTIIGYNLHPGVAGFLLKDPNGPLIVEYLASNLDELGDLATMDPYEAVVHVRTAISPKASKLKPKLSNAPPPLKKPTKGKGSDPNKEFMDGVTLE